MPEIAGRIRWNENTRLHLWTGDVGTIGPMYTIILPLDGDGEHLLTSSFPGQETNRSSSTDLGGLKAQAERWLEEHAASIGAIFPDVLRAEVESMRTAQRQAAEGPSDDWSAERCCGAVDTLDWMLRVIRGMTAKTESSDEQEANPTPAGKE